MTALTAEEKKVADRFRIPYGDFAREKARTANRGKAVNACGLNKDELAVCRNFGISPRALAAAKGRRTERPGLINALQELDAAHKAEYEDSASHPGGVDGSPDQELFDKALTELKAFKLADEDNTYQRLVNGFLYVAKLVNRIAPAYADQE